MRDLEPFEKDIYIDFSNAKYKTNSFAEYLISHIESGWLKVGFELPSVVQLSGIVKLSISTLDRAFRIMDSKGYLIRENGVCAVIRHPSYIPSSHVNKDIFYMDDQCMKPGPLTDQLHSLYQKTKEKHYRNTLPKLQNNIYEDLILTLCEQLNRQQRTFYKTPEIYYMHDYQSLIRSIGRVLTGDGGGIVIPKTVSNIIRRSFEALNIKLFEVDSDERGFSAKGLAEICSQQKVTAVYLMPEINYPDTTDIDPARIQEIIALQKAYHFLIIIDDRYRPWLTKGNLMLDLCAEIIDSIIYLKPVSYLYEELCRLNVIAAKACFIEKIRLTAKEHGKQAYYSSAFAADFILTHNVYNQTVQAANLAVEEIKQIVNEVFTASGFWKLDGLRMESGPALYIVPRVGHFPADAYEQLKVLETVVVNPESYGTGVIPLEGLRAEFTYHLGKKNLKIRFQKMEKDMRMLIEAELEPEKFNTAKMMG